MTDIHMRPRSFRATRCIGEEQKRGGRGKQAFASDTTQYNQCDAKPLNTPGVAHQYITNANPAKLWSQIHGLLAAFWEMLGEASSEPGQAGGALILLA